MKFLEYLYYKYYSFQVKVGNGDVASFSSMLIIAFTIVLYFFSFLFWIMLLWPKSGLDIRYLMPISLLLLIVLIFALYNLLVRNGKYKKILRKNNNYEEKRNFGAILFPLIAFLLFNFGWILKMLQNQGRL